MPICGFPARTHKNSADKFLEKGKCALINSAASCVSERVCAFLIWDNSAVEQLVGWLSDCSAARKPHFCSSSSTAGSLLHFIVWWAPKDTERALYYMDKNTTDWAARRNLRLLQSAPCSQLASKGFGFIFLCGRVHARGHLSTPRRDATWMHLTYHYDLCTLSTRILCESTSCHEILSYLGPRENGFDF